MGSNAFVVSDKRAGNNAPAVIRIILDIPIQDIAEVFYNIDEFVWFYKSMGWDNENPVTESYLYNRVKQEFDNGATIVYYVATPESVAIKSDFEVKLPAGVDVVHGDEEDVVETILSLANEL